MINKTEAEITANWKHRDTPLVSCCCPTFNQEPFIGQALDSILMQVTDFPFEIVVRDDFSQDGTTQLIEHYAEIFPSIINPIYEEENRYSKGIRALPIVLNKSKGSYIAICEGDDYWTDSNKLQRQLRFLSDNPEYTATAENAWVQFESGKEIIFSCKPERDILLKELANSRQFATGSLMFKASDELAANLKPYLFCDTPLVLSLAKNGKIRYFGNFSSVYRRHSDGVTNQIGKSKEYTENVVDYLHQLNILLDNEFAQIFNLKIAQTYFGYAAYCFPNKANDFLEFLYKAAKYDLSATFMFFLRELLPVDKVVGKFVSRSNNQQAFIK